MIKLFSVLVLMSISATTVAQKSTGFSLVEKSAPVVFYIHTQTLERFTENKLATSSLENEDPLLIKIFNSGSNKYILFRKPYTS